MKHVLVALGLTAAFWVSPAQAQNACASFEIVGTSVTDDYNPFDASPLAKTFAVKVTRLSPGARGVRFLLLDTTPSATGPRIGTGGPENYEIQWLTDTGRMVFATGAQSINQTNGATVSFGNGSSGSVATTSFQLLVPRGQPAAAGLQTENLAVRYQCLSGSGSGGQENEQRTGEVRLDIRVPQYVAAYIGSVGQTRGTIAFGPLTGSSGNVRKSLAVTALSTVPYEVRFRTDNDGRMKRAPSEPGGIGYSMRYGGVPVASGSKLTCPTTEAPLGRIEEFEVTVDGSTVRALPAGDYADVVTMTFQPRDGGIVSGCQSGGI